MATTWMEPQSPESQRQIPHGLTSKEVDLTEVEGRTKWLPRSSTVMDEEEVREGTLLRGYSPREEEDVK